MPRSVQILNYGLYPIAALLLAACAPVPPSAGASSDRRLEHTVYLNGTGEPRCSWTFDVQADEDARASCGSYADSLSCLVIYKKDGRVLERCVEAKRNPVGPLPLPSPSPTPLRVTGRVGGS
ncbi:MAG TPA: hypothetical protein VD948_08760 [Rhodothermales bacterium]|nr:hypothetical protein [Rhodothermales bacterium]